MRRFTQLALGLLPVFVSAGQAQTIQSSLAPPLAPPLASPLLTPGQAASDEDPVLAGLIREALDHNPELIRSHSLVDAEKERIPQAGALPDPSLSLGLQNDGFKRLQVGRMETSYYQVMLTQPLPWPGKRAIRSDIARLGVEAARSTSERARLSLIAEVKRAYLGLLLVRAQQGLLDQQALFQQKATEITRLRYEVGQGSQADLLRAQLEQNRLRQKRIALHSEERVLASNLNHMRGMDDESSIPVTPFPEHLPARVPAPIWMDRAEQESPELQGARLGVQQAERSLDLAKRDRLPDFAVSAGLMPRGSLDPMWQVGVSISLPLWSRQKQQRAVAEQEIRRRAQGSEADSVRHLLAQRIQEREAQLDAALDTIQLYKEGLLVQSEASFQASLAQYEVGRSSFLSVLEALNGWIADRSGYLQALSQAHAIQIAQEEFNLAGTPPIASQSLSAAPMGMGGSPSSAPSPKPSGRGAGSGPSADASNGSAMKSM